MFTEAPDYCWGILKVKIITTGGVDGKVFNLTTGHLPL